jgi:hypothetical protein
MLSREGNLSEVPATGIDPGVCERLVSAAVRSCPQPVLSSMPPLPTNPPAVDWDPLANSFAALSAAFTWGAVLLAILTIALGLGWGILVRNWAEKEARKEAKEGVELHMRKWFAEEAPRLVRQHVELLQNTTIGATSDGEAADEIGKEAG